MLTLECLRCSEHRHGRKLPQSFVASMLFPSEWCGHKRRQDFVISHLYKRPQTMFSACVPAWWLENLHNSLTHETFLTRTGYAHLPPSRQAFSDVSNVPTTVVPNLSRRQTMMFHLGALLIEVRVCQLTPDSTSAAFATQPILW